MCGIAGIVVNPGKSMPDIRERLAKMASMMKHRGPDDEGIYVSPDGNVGLVNRRLAIRDLSSAGHMPMSTKSGEIWITYNGEIYNAQELRQELEGLGHVFNSHSDTEVILKGYEAWGKGILPRLHGMFAFAIHDLNGTASSDSQYGPSLLLARDHMGIKPLYYAYTSDALIFASELKTLLAANLCGKSISSNGLIGYFLTGSVPNPHTIYQDIQALQPAHFIELPLQTFREPASMPYWEMPIDIAEVKNIHEVAEQIDLLLKDAVRIRLVSDVPLGAFLSGGLDSSAIVALMRQATSGPIRTCSMVFNETEYSEAHYARIMADRIGAEHYERVIVANDIIKEFDRVLYAMDQPTIDGVNTYFVSQTAREAGLTVALSGVGGDELFGGYASTFRGVPSLLNALRVTQAVPGGAWLSRNVINGMRDPRRWMRIQDALQRPPSIASAYLARRGVFAPTEVRQLLSGDFWQSANSNFDPLSSLVTRIHDEQSPKDPFAWISRAEMTSYMHDQLLRDTDVMSMAHSLEVRVPLLDSRLVSTLLSMPGWAKRDRNGTLKALLVQVMEKYLPDTIVQRRHKQGFTFPFDTWLRTDLKGQTLQVLDSIKSFEWINASAVDRLWSDFERHEVHWSRVWSLVALGSLLVTADHI